MCGYKSREAQMGTARCGYKSCEAQHEGLDFEEGDFDNRFLY
jgi:hypothetical protein